MEAETVTQEKGTADLLVPIQKASRDLMRAIKLSEKWPRGAIRYLVDYYYQIQDARIRAAHHSTETELAKCEIKEISDLVVWLSQSMELLEHGIVRVLDLATDKTLTGRWAKSICGIGPVIAAGLTAYYDIAPPQTVPEGKGHKNRKPAKPPTSASSFWKLAGLYPGAHRVRGQKVDWNPALKRLCFLIGESFTKVSGRESDFYGQLWLKFKAKEWAENLAGDLADQAAAALAEKKFGEDTNARLWYEGRIRPEFAAKWIADRAFPAQIPKEAILPPEEKGPGMLPPARIQLRAQRMAVKIFLAHLWEVMYFEHHGKRPDVKPFVFDRLKHSHYVDIPNWPMPKPKGVK